MKLTSDEARTILENFRETTQSDKWIDHCICVGDTAGRIAQALKEKGYNSTKLRKEKLLGENAIQSLRKDEMVGIIALEKLCSILEMQPGDIIEYTPEKH